MGGAELRRDWSEEWWAGFKEAGGAAWSNQAGSSYVYLNIVINFSHKLRQEAAAQNCLVQTAA